MSEKRIITCAVTGAGDTVKKNRHVPVTPKQIAEAAIAAAREGAAVAHIHARDPETGGISHNRDHYREIVERIRAAETDVVLNITAGGGGDWVPALKDPARGGPGTDMQRPEERHAPVGELLPELCTLDCGSLNFGDQVYLSPAEWLRRQARLIGGAGVKAEMECFDFGHLRFARQLIREGLMEGAPIFQFCLGIPWGAEDDVETMFLMRNKLPEGAHWSAFGIGGRQMPVAAQAALLGGNIRVGLEDNLYLSRGVPATNEALTAKAVVMLQGVGMEPMTPREAREHLGVTRREK